MNPSKTYLIAGASSAIAKAVADQLIHEGHKVIGISRQENLPNLTESYLIERYDFGLFPKIDQQFNGLLYFPGSIQLKPFGRLSPADFQNDLSVHALGAAAFVQSYLPQLEKDSNSSIIFISSVAATTGMPYHASVSMAKGALEGLTKSLAAELAPSVRVNAIAPSLVNTPMGEKFINSPEKLEAIQKRNPMRKVGNPADIAGTICFLLSNQSSWITGQIIAVDGGMNTLKI